jgi:predicted SAM-dependent methyltransferase
MLMKRILKRLLGKDEASLGGHDSPLHRRVLCIGGVNEFATMPHHYSGWIKDLLSERPLEGARFVKSVLQLKEFEAATYDAVYYSHQLKDHSLHEGQLILQGIWHMLKPGGFLHLRVPDVLSLMHQLVQKGHGLEDVAYMSAAGPISYHDVLWGRSIELATAGFKDKGHRAGFSPKLLERMLADSGFHAVRRIESPDTLELEVIAAVDRLHDDYRIMLGLKAVDVKT